MFMPTLEDHLHSHLQHPAVPNGMIHIFLDIFKLPSGKQPSQSIWKRDGGERHTKGCESHFSPPSETLMCTCVCCHVSIVSISGEQTSTTKLPTKQILWCNSDWINITPTAVIIYWWCIYDSQGLWLKNKRKTISIANKTVAFLHNIAN